MDWVIKDVEVSITVDQFPILHTCLTRNSVDL